MNLDEYLKALKSCPDSELRDELGVYDNWPVFINTDFEEFVGKLRSSGKYELRTTYDKPRSDWFLFLPNIAILQVLSWPLPLVGKDYGEEFQRRLKDYPKSLMLHPVRDKSETVPYSRRLAIVIDDIGQLLIREKIPACMPDSIGWRYRDSKDISKVVYHEPN